MTGLLGVPASVRARALADAPVDVLAPRGDQLASAWAAALVITRPLQRIGDLALGDLALDGAAVCVGALRALESDPALSELVASRAPSRLGAIAGAEADAAAVVAAVEALRSVLWHALGAELGEAPPRLLLDAADRLAYVLAALTEAALAALASEHRDEEAPTSLADALAARVSSRPKGVARPPAPRPSPAVVIVDEQVQAPPLDEPEPHAFAARQEISVQDQRAASAARGGQGPAAWIDSIGRELRGHGADGHPFAVLLVQAGDPEHRARALGADATTASVEAVLASAARGPDGGSLTRERPGRWWLVVAGCDRSGSQLLAARIERDLTGLAATRGQPLQVAIGTASCPQDGSDAAALAAHADVGLYAARAAARAAAARPSAGDGAAGERGGL
jgi:GGDEF domain-containing protein